MASDFPEFKPDLRGVLISKVQHGELTPKQAEAEAKAKGLPPFETTPDPAHYDPMTESRWTLVMAVAWIAWRDIERVIECGAEFSSKRTLWRYREWNKPIEGGTKFSLQKGWFLESWREPTTNYLSFLEIILREKNQLPFTACMSVGDAEKGLWRALSEGKLVAEALDHQGKPVDVPQREWSYLKLFEDGKQDVLRYEPLDRNEPFTNLKLKRDDLRRLWPAAPPSNKGEARCREWLISLMAASPTKKPKSKPAFFEEAQTMFPGLGKRRFHAAWTRAIEETGATAWEKAGAPRKN